jgi:hypothetical protein
MIWLRDIVFPMREKLPFLFLAASVSAGAQIISPQAKLCGPELSADDVLVLDLESFGDDVQRAEAFTAAHVTDLRLISERAETVRTFRRAARNTREHGLRQAQREAAERGCNVALVLRAWTEESAVVETQNISVNTGLLIGLRYAFAEVQFGTGKH